MQMIGIMMMVVPTAAIIVVIFSMIWKDYGFTLVILTIAGVIWFGIALELITYDDPCVLGKLSEFNPNACMHLDHSR